MQDDFSFLPVNESIFTDISQALAFARAEHLSRSRDWTGMCLAFSRSCWQVPPLYGNATEGWMATKNRGTGTSPPGALEWWTGGSRGYGHVALSAGSEEIWTSDLIRQGQIDLAQRSIVSQKWGLSYAGWSRDINEVKVLDSLSQETTMIEGCDYSYARPNLSCLFSPPYNMRFVVRYVQNRPIEKNMTAAETKSLAAAGFSIVTVCQQGTSPMMDGRNRGIELATGALKEATTCGMPAGRPIYFALDIDPNAFTTTQWTACKEFLGGAATVIGLRNVGVYGARKAIDILCPGWAPWGWQTYAWSGNVWSVKAQLQQYKNNVTICNENIDHDRATVTDYGQWKPGQAVPDTIRQLNEQDKTFLLGPFAQAVRF